jgi:hypothetical protein
MSGNDNPPYTLKHTAAATGTAKSDCCRSHIDICLPHPIRPVGQNLCILDSLPRRDDAGLVAAGLTLEPCLSADPPYRGIEKQYRLNHHLAEVN